MEETSVVKTDKEQKLHKKRLFWIIFILVCIGIGAYSGAKANNEVAKGYEIDYRYEATCGGFYGQTPTCNMTCIITNRSGRTISFDISKFAVTFDMDSKKLIDSQIITLQNGESYTYSISWRYSDYNDYGYLTMDFVSMKYNNKALFYNTVSKYQRNDPLFLQTFAGHGSTKIDCD